MSETKNFGKSIRARLLNVAKQEEEGHGDRYIGSLFRVDEPVPDDSRNYIQSSEPPNMVCR